MFRDVEAGNEIANRQLSRSCRSRAFLVESECPQWRTTNPACGQCNVTALLIQECYGGDILKTPLVAGDHLYNRIDGRRLDFTASQFVQPIAYADLPSSRAEAKLGATQAEYEALRSAFLLAFDVRT